MTYDGLKAAELAALIQAPGCVVHASVPSAMDVVHELARDGAPAGTVVLADEQVAGRGRHGRLWHSARGRGIWLGYLVRPGRATESGVLALRVGLAISDALCALGVSTRLKWPNDVVLEDRKLAGVLCEARWTADRLSWIAVGIGINVHGPLPGEIATQAIALSEVLPGASRVQVLEMLVPRLHQLGPDPALTATEREAFQRVDWLAGRRLKEPVRGIASGVDPQGALLVETGRGIQRVVGGGVVCS